MTVSPQRTASLFPAQGMDTEAAALMEAAEFVSGPVRPHDHAELAAALDPARRARCSAGLCGRGMGVMCLVQLSWRRPWTRRGGSAAAPLQSAAPSAGQAARAHRGRRQTPAAAPRPPSARLLAHRLPPALPPSRPRRLKDSRPVLVRDLSDTVVPPPEGALKGEGPPEPLERGGQAARLLWEDLGGRCLYLSAVRAARAGCARCAGPDGVAAAAGAGWLRSLLVLCGSRPAQCSARISAAATSTARPTRLPRPPLVIAGLVVVRGVLRPPPDPVPHGRQAQGARSPHASQPRAHPARPGPARAVPGRAAARAAARCSAALARRACCRAAHAALSLPADRGRAAPPSLSRDGPQVDWTIQLGLWESSDWGLNATTSSGLYPDLTRVRRSCGRAILAPCGPLAACPAARLAAWLLAHRLYVCPPPAVHAHWCLSHAAGLPAGLPGAA